MHYLSTSGSAPKVDLRTALFRSLAPDRGLYMPETVPVLPEAFFERLPGMTLVEIAATVMPALLPDLPEERVRAVVEDALNFPVPLVEIEPGVHILELFHGPTLAFKDVGARFMARLFAELADEGDGPLTVLVATSGDTGSAVAQAFLGVPGTRVAVLYPEGRVSPIQECQFTTLGGDAGGNIQALAVDGAFDDCQRLVKAAFADPELSSALHLTSANSINLGRLLPQSLYYFVAVAQWGNAPPPVFSVPSGNFGNLTAGLLARHMGLPVAGFIAATNANDVVPEYLASGHYRPRPSVATLSNAMDVGDPSNLPRILHLLDGDLAAVRRWVRGRRYSDAETQATIREVFERTGYTLDPHTAIGYRGLEGQPGIVLATAHPVKFREHVEPLIGREIPVPERLTEALARPRRSLPLAPEEEALKEFLRGWSAGSGQGV